MDSSRSVPFAPNFSLALGVGVLEALPSPKPVTQRSLGRQGVVVGRNKADSPIPSL